MTQRRIIHTFLRVIVSTIILSAFVLHHASTNAELGNVKVDFNITSDRRGPVRANTINEFKIFFRINEDIKTHDWVKVWFPIDEASCDPADICGDEFVIKGHDESPRFVPNEKYFEKYDNDYEEDNGKLYEIIGNKVEIRFFEPTLCTEPKGNCRMVEDPSGLGYWMMGTVLPALPKDEAERKEQAARIIYGAQLGYVPCECQGYPTLKQTCNERSFQVSSHLHVEAWRQGYNPADWSFYKSAGIMFPATPGRYRLQIATQREPTPIESESFVLPCSQISTPKLTQYKYEFEEDGHYTIKFDTGEGGALDSGSSLISIKFPDCVKISNNLKPTQISVNNVPLKAEPQLDKATNTLTFVVSANVDNVDTARIDIPDFALENTCDEPFTVEVMTSSEPEFVESTPLERASISSIWIGDVELSNPKGAEVSSYKFSINVPSDCDLQEGDILEVGFPGGTIFPEFIKPENVRIGDNSVKSVSINNNSLKVALIEGVTSEKKIEVFLSKECGIRNTFYGDKYRLFIKTTCIDNLSYSRPFEIEVIPLKSELTLSPHKPDGCNGWYINQPTFSISCNNPDAEIIYWYEGHDDKQKYTEPVTLKGFQNITRINYFSNCFTQEEPTKSSEIVRIDLVKPKLTIDNPRKKEFITSLESIIIMGTREYRTIYSCFSQPDLMLDGVSIRYNNQERQIIEKAVVFSNKDKDLYKTNWEIKVPLTEGVNKIDVIGTDQACNEKVWTYHITKDKVPPKIKIVEPIDINAVNSDSVIYLTIETDIDADDVTINGRNARFVKALSDNSVLYNIDLDFINPCTDETVEIKVTDKAGNVSTKTVTLKPKLPLENYRTNFMKIWIDKGDIQIGKALFEDFLSPTPTVSSPPLPKNLAGNTYIPLRGVLESMMADIAWIPEKRVAQIWSTTNNCTKLYIELEIGNQIAKVNGEEVEIVSADGKTKLYQTIVEGRTMVPLRFLTEALGAKVNWIEDERAIEIIP